MEIEKKFLIESDIEKFLQNLPCKEIFQYYINIEDNEERYRKKDDKFFHTIKRATSNYLIREEFEIECSKAEFENNKDRMIGNMIHKLRYNFDLDEGLVAEIDVFKEQLEGLVLVEVEFKTEEQAVNFTPLSFFGKDVTDDKKYKNKNLIFLSYINKNLLKI